MNRQIGKSKRGWGTELRLAAGLIASISAISGGWAAQVSGGPYGVVEIGGKGVKAYTFDIDGAAEKPECQNNDAARVDCFNAETLPAINIGSGMDVMPFTATTDAASRQVKLLTDKYGVKKERIYIIASGGVTNKDSAQAIAAAVDEKLSSEFGPMRPLDLVKSDAEMKYAFKSVGVILRRSELDSAVIFDIAGVKTDAFYMDPSLGPEPTTFSISTGTTAAAKGIADIQGSGDLNSAVVQWRTQTLSPLIFGPLDAHPAVYHKNSIYLMGGLPYVLVTLTQPHNQDTRARISVNNVERLYAEASSAAPTLCKGPRYEKEENEQAEACRIFSLADLAAGSQIILALMDKLEVNNNHKKVFFTRDSQFAWPLGYLLDHVASSANQAPSAGH